MRIAPPASPRTQAVWHGASQQRAITRGNGTALRELPPGLGPVAPARRGQHRPRVDVHGTSRVAGGGLVLDALFLEGEEFLQIHLSSFSKTGRPAPTIQNSAGRPQPRPPKRPDATVSPQYAWTSSVIDLRTFSGSAGRCRTRAPQASSIALMIAVCGDVSGASPQPEAP